MFSLNNMVLAGAALLLACVFFQPRLIAAPGWRATVTPLASIIGSGFLVAGPILAHAVGPLAWLAMLALCGLSYWFGAAIRYNIRYVEPSLLAQPPRYQVGLERLSELALALAYFVSVAYYLNLFAAFGMRLGDVADPVWTRVLATVVIAGIGLLGALRGLAGLERLEVMVVARGDGGGFEAVADRRVGGDVGAGQYVGGAGRLFQLGGASAFARDAAARSAAGAGDSGAGF